MLDTLERPDMPDAPAEADNGQLARIARQSVIAQLYNQF